MEDIRILAIETSCDETAAAVVKNGREIISEALYTQIEIHKEYGGVVPELASRNHVEKLPGVVEAAVRAAGGFDEIDAIAVTNGPGLVGALLTGVSYAKGLAYVLKKPLIAVHHIAGHICANYISHRELEPPFLCLVVSGGHTQIVLARDYTTYETLGRTRDDAAGEAIDKVARVLGLASVSYTHLDVYKRQAYDRILNCRENLEFVMANPKDNAVQVAPAIAALNEKFNAAMDDDLNTADAIGGIFEYVKEINTLFSDGGRAQDAKAAKDAMDALLDVLGILPAEESEIPNEVMELAEKRQAARAEKNWAEADRLRDEINSLGYELKDTPDGVKINQI